MKFRIEMNSERQYGGDSVWEISNIVDESSKIRIKIDDDDFHIVDGFDLIHAINVVLGKSTL